MSKESSSTRSYTRKFINELGNSITLTVRDFPMAECEGIHLGIECPTSATSWELTRREANVLLQELKNFLE